MLKSGRQALILIADDDPDDRMLAAEALEEVGVVNEIRFVVDGEELLDYLLHRGDYIDPDQSPRPDLILLDLNMPRKDGWEALHEIKKYITLRHIPIIVLTTSSRSEDIQRSYDLGASSFIVKSISFRDLTEVMKTLSNYWFYTVELPPEEET